MSSPGFTAESSLYATKIQYRIAGARARAEADARITPASDAYTIFRAHAESWADHATASYGEGHEGDTNRAVLPMSVPGHKTDLTTECDFCKGECLAIATGCEATAVLGCLPTLAIPIVGGAVYAGCVAVATAACVAGEAYCVGQCENVGSACCPTACGVGCCARSESCLDTAQGLCCSAGTLPCPGPEESCYDPRKEKCLPSGIGCPAGQECGYNCCGPYAECVDPNSGLCCGLLTGIPCGNKCCDGSTQRCTDSGCCPTAQACGGTCCLEGSICDPSGVCVVAETCQPGQFLCVSADKTQQNCCAGDQDCCYDGSCCGGSNNPYVMCCGSRGCQLTSDCIG